MDKSFLFFFSFLSFFVFFFCPLSLLFSIFFLLKGETTTWSLFLFLFLFFSCFFFIFLFYPFFTWSTFYIFFIPFHFFFLLFAFSSLFVFSFFLLKGKKIKTWSSFIYIYFFLLPHFSFVFLFLVFVYPAIRSFLAFLILLVVLHSVGTRPSQSPRLETGAATSFQPEREAWRCEPWWVFQSSSVWTQPASEADLWLTSGWPLVDLWLCAQQERDVREGADMLMVKPGLPYLDIMREVKDKVSRRAFPHFCVFYFLAINPSISLSTHIFINSPVHPHLSIHSFIHLSIVIVPVLIFWHCVFLDPPCSSPPILWRCITCRGSLPCCGTERRPERLTCGPLWWRPWPPSAGQVRQRNPPADKLRAKFRGSGSRKRKLLHDLK